MTRFKGNKIYRAQTALRIRCTCGNIAGAQAARLWYRKPDGTEGSWTAVVEDTTPTGHVYVDLSATGQLDQAGDWRFWPKIGFLVGSAAGEAVLVKVYEEGE